MYNAMLDRVITAITDVVGYQPIEEKRSEFFNLMFNPEAYSATQEKKRRREDLKNKLILGATAIAVVGELTHLSKPLISRIANKIQK